MKRGIFNDRMRELIDEKDELDSNVQRVRKEEPGA